MWTKEEVMKSLSRLDDGAIVRVMVVFNGNTEAEVYERVDINAIGTEDGFKSMDIFVDAP